LYNGRVDIGGDLGRGEREGRLPQQIKKSREVMGEFGITWGK